MYNVNDIVSFIKLKRLKWSGHEYKMDDHLVPKRILEGRRYGTRPKGRQKNRWMDAVSVDARGLLRIMAWRHVATERTEWRHRIEKLGSAQSPIVVP